MQKKLPLRDSDACPFPAVAPDVFGYQNVMVNVFAVRSGPGHWVLIDAGLPYSAGPIRNWVKKTLGPDYPPKAILLTHGHFDHVGALKTLAEEWDVPVYAHAAEMKYLNGTAPYPPPNPMADRGMMSWLSPLYPRGPIRVGTRLQTLPEDGSVPYLSNWRWVYTPGHTDGHVSFWRESDRCLIAGDAVITTQQESALAVATQRLQMEGPPAYFTPDWSSAKSSVEKLAALEPAIVATGHGIPVTGDSARQIATLAAEFDEIAVPCYPSWWKWAGVAIAVTGILMTSLLNKRRQSPSIP